MKWFTFEGRKPQENQRILGLLKDICNLDLWARLKRRIQGPYSKTTRQ